VTPFIVATERYEWIDTPDSSAKERRTVCVAVATLEEARVAAWRLVPDCDCKCACEAEKACAQAFMLTEAGGTIPLPDGSRVVVEPCDYERLAREAEIPATTAEGYFHDERWDLILAAWNREFGRGEHNTADAKALADARGQASGKFDPDWVVAPGETLREWRSENGISAQATATACGHMSLDVFERIESGTQPLTEDIAAGLARGTGIPAYLWLNLERAFRAGLAAGKTWTP
jgi:plasmid maintenance system antidote protein VapI